MCVRSWGMSSHLAGESRPYPGPVFDAGSGTAAPTPEPIARIDDLEGPPRAQVTQLQLRVEEGEASTIRLPRRRVESAGVNVFAVEPPGVSEATRQVFDRIGLVLAVADRRPSTQRKALVGEIALWSPLSPCGYGS